MKERAPVEAAREQLRALPSAAEFLEAPAGKALAGELGAGVVKLELRRLLDELRGALRSGRRRAPAVEELAGAVRERAVRLARPEGRRAINATGILLHTGLGRAPLCEEALAALAGMGRFSILQADVETGERSLREEKLERMLMELTGCEAATVVNNNAAATMLALNTLAAGKEAVVSRGQLVEIGGAFRMPEVMAASGAALREVGTTNRTHLSDYAAAVGPQTGVLLHVHTSNYRIRGFSAMPGMEELCALGRERGVPVLDDLGSGALVSLREFGLSDEPLVRDSLAAGAEAVCFSGDKLLGGAQAGFILGKRAAIERMRKNPLARMFRVCKLTHAALEATLPRYLDGSWRQAIPFYRLLARKEAELEETARRLAAALRALPGLTVEVSAEQSFVGSGAAPDEGLPDRAVRLRAEGVAAEALARALRAGIPSVFPRVQGGEVLLNARTLLAGEAEELPGLVARACERARG